MAQNEQATVYFRPAALAEHWSDNGGTHHYIGLSDAVKELLARRGRRVDEVARLLPGVCPGQRGA